MAKESIGAKTIVYPTPTFIVCTYDSDDKPNAATVAWGGICCSRPPCVAVSLRAATYSHGNIEKKKAFTVNIPSEKYVKVTDYFGIASGRDTDKFEATGLTSIRSDLVDAPYIDEFPLVLECRLINTVEIGLHTQFVGEILDVKAEAAIIGENGLSDIEKAQPILFAPDSHRYFGLGKYLGKAFSVGREIK